MQASESNPWVEDTPSVALYGGGERATAAEVAETNNTFRELMSRMSASARDCDDINVRASGKRMHAYEDRVTAEDSTVVARYGTRDSYVCNADWVGGGKLLVGTPAAPRP